MQVWLGSRDGDGMPVELLEPWAVDQNDFLARFVARHGAGPHHLTFKVPDLADAVARVRGAGFHPVNIDVVRSRVEGSVPHAARSARHRRAARGVARSSRDAQGAARLRRRARPEHAVRAGGSIPRRATGHGTLRRVVLRTPSLPSALGFFAGVLQGDVEARDADVGRSRVAARRARPPGDERRRAARRRPPRGRSVSPRSAPSSAPASSPTDRRELGGRTRRAHASARRAAAASSRTMRRTASCTAWSASESCTPRAVTSARRRGGMRAMRSWRTPT